MKTAQTAPGRKPPQNRNFLTPTRNTPTTEATHHQQPPQEQPRSNPTQPDTQPGKTDSELLAYVMANLAPKRTPSEIKAWSVWYSQQAPDNPDSRGFFNDVHRKNGAHRKDIETWFDWLELDDYVTYGGRP